MNADRLTLLKSFVEKNPGDPFAYYGLAMEYVRSGLIEEALQIFYHLLEKHSDYVPTYFQAGAALQKTGDIERARHVLRKGVEVAGRLGNIHARDELQQALEGIEG